ncbi:MAG: glycoside hydrolase family 1 protein [Patescibacteria group bacterium]
MAKFDFPKGFYWGAATSAHQVEGKNNNDWTEWEKEHANRLANEASKKKFPEHILNLNPSPLDQNNYISGEACDHYNRFREDFDIAKSLGHNAHRFSIEWSRIEPTEGQWNQKEIQHYQDVINALRERGIEPFVTLWHWTLPTWVAKQGGWENKKTIDDFVRYTYKVTASLQGVKYWITLNEPEVYTGKSYFTGTWPPQKKSLIKFFKVFCNLIEAHKEAYTTISKTGAFSGISQNNFYFNLFLNKISDYQNFIGINYYKYWNLGRLKSDMNWPIYPKGIFHVLKDLKKYKKPIYITENGLADAKDEKRSDFIREHIKWIARAMKEGANVRGYLHWSLLDNFEWSDGFWPKFGLVEMNYNTMERKIRQSAYEYKKIIESNSIEI